jgi:PKD domain
MSLSMAAFAPTATATTFGQIGEAWGSPGSGAGQFFSPAMLGADPGDGSVYAGDVTPDGKHYRIQKLSDSGEFEAAVEIPRIVEEKIVTLHGIAVDPVLHRLYLIEGCHLAKPGGSCKSFGSTFGARRLLVFSTEPQGTELVPAEGAATLPLPGGEETLYAPQTIAVDPSNHDLVILAENISGHTAIQRISSAGVAGARFVDTGNVLRPAGEEANSIAVGPTGTTYTLTGGPNVAGAEHTRAWEFPPNLSSLAMVPGFAEAAESEGWSTGLLSPKSSPLLGGPQIAVSPGGSTLYWKENLQPSTPTEAGEVLVRGYSLTEDATQVVYGDGKERCAITTSSAGLATTGEDLVAFDYGPEGEAPPYGDKVITFGPGGTGCPAPVAKFSVNGKEEEGVTVKKGEVVAFDASNSELFEGFRRELIWKFGDGTEKVVEFTPETATEPAEEAEPTVTHQYASAGEFTVRLEIKLSEAPFGSPPPVERTLKVQVPPGPRRSP